MITVNALEWRIETDEDPPHTSSLLAIGERRNFVVARCVKRKQKDKLLLMAPSWALGRELVDENFEPVWDKLGYFDDIFEAIKKAEKVNIEDQQKEPK